MIMAFTRLLMLNIKIHNFLWEVSIVRMRTNRYLGIGEILFLMIKYLMGNTL